MIAGFDITAAKDGAEGVGLAATDPPDLILMDLNLPVMSG
jgi:CheY-like chemotaxis protein